VWRPAIQIDEGLATPELDRALDRLDGFDWIAFTSPRAVAAVWRRMASRDLDPSRLGSKAIAVVGPGTARALRGRGVRARLIGEPHSAKGLLAAMTPAIRDTHASVLYPRAATVSPTLVTGLRALGADVVDVVAYRTSPVHQRGAVTKTLSGRVDCAVFCSRSAIVAAEHLRSELDGSAIACIGPVTAEAARAAGFPVSIVPRVTTIPALAQAIAEHFARISP
jgi:uroporphyrinogen III methyltransferase/synthase